MHIKEATNRLNRTIIRFIRNMKILLTYVTMQHYCMVTLGPSTVLSFVVHNFTPLHLLLFRTSKLISPAATKLNIAVRWLHLAKANKLAGDKGMGPLRFLTRCIECNAV